MADISSLPAMGSWRGDHAILVGGGPSLKGFDFSKLSGHRTAVVNMAYYFAPDADLLFSEDFRFFKRANAIPEESDDLKPELLEQLADFKKAWARFTGKKVFSCLAKSFEQPALDMDKDIIIIPRKRPDKFWSKSYDEGMCYASNSMIGLLNLVDLLGADPIYLLGVDCNHVGQKTVNFHEFYPNTAEWRTGDVQYDSFKSEFEVWAALHLRNSGKSVINLNPDSAVNCWPKKKWSDVF